MKNYKTYFLLLIAFCFCIGCKKNDDNHYPSGHYLVTGYISGFCATPCSYFYLLQNNELRKSGAVQYYSNSLAYNNQASATEYALVQNLESLIPDTLYQLNNQSFGCPNCHDQGGYYLTVSKNNQVYEWRLDPDIKDSSSHFLRPLVMHLTSMYGQLSH